jgi:hypothetical protein
MLNILHVYSWITVLLPGCNGTTAGLNGTTAGLGYLEVLELSMQILLLGQLANVLTVSSQWGRRIQFLY